MKFSSVVPALVPVTLITLTSVKGDSPTLRGGSLNLDAPTLNSAVQVAAPPTRTLVEEYGTFQPLSCNNPYCAKGETTWQDSNFDLTQKVVIPCGVCVTMDYPAGNDPLVLEKGIDVQGRLTFPDGYQLTIMTPSFVVQGELEMSSNRPITGSPDIKVILTGNDEEVTSFLPADTNSGKCMGGACQFGVKPFVAAGGKLNIAGFPEKCPTWLSLEDVMVATKPTSTNYDTAITPPNDPSLPAVCAERVLIDETFDPGTFPREWDGYLGAEYAFTSAGTLKVFDRTYYAQGPTLDLRGIAKCLLPTTYLLTARVRLTKPGTATGTPTTCQSTGKNCLYLTSYVHADTDESDTKEYWGGTELIAKYDEWAYVHAELDLSADEANPAGFLYHTLRFAGPEEGVDIELDDVKIFLPSDDAYPVDNPQEVCGNLAPKAGDAESMGWSPFPFKKSGAYLAIKEEITADGPNKFFRHYSRSKTWHSLTFDVLPDCMVESATYKLSAKLRIRSETPKEGTFEIRTYYNDGVDSYSVDTDIVTCESDISDWTLCEGEFQMTEAMTSSTAYRWRIMLQTELSAAGFDVDYDDLRVEFMGGPIQGLVLPGTTLASCWDEGAEILISSHSLQYNGDQVRTIAGIPYIYGNNTVVSLNLPIDVPITKKQSDDFAVEVALLSRNIVFEGASDHGTGVEGAHFVVANTPQVVQRIEGVEFRNFGQEGVPGRFPIHFDTCGDVDGSVVSKNSIRESNQRCVVVGGTNKLSVTENVAYDTKDHCYMLDQGVEVDNIFQKNLGAYTRSSDSVSYPGTFFITNPSNSWEGNVAAGSRGSGFYFDLVTSAKQLPLGSFRDNVAHSNSIHGLRTNPNGYTPEKAAVFFNTKSYRNKMVGVKFDDSENLSIERGVFADNDIQIQLDETSNITVEQAFVIGASASFRTVVEEQGASRNCKVIGLDLHTFNADRSIPGATVKDVSFSGFGYSDLCAGSVAIDFDDAKNDAGTFDYWSTFEGLTFGDKMNQVSICDAETAGVTDIVATDMDSSLKPEGVSTSGPSSIVSNSQVMTAFVEDGKCVDVASGCYKYCADTCFRPIRYHVYASGTDDFKLRISDQADALNFIEVPSISHEEGSTHSKQRLFEAYLPPGSYDASFVDGNGDAAWPKYVEESYGEALCDVSLADGAVTLKTDVDESECGELIKNGDAEMSSTGHPFWSHVSGGIEVSIGEGRDGSNAFTDESYTQDYDGISQYLDSRCIEKMQGRQYEVKAWIRLVNPADGTPYQCTNSDTCPRVVFRLYDQAEDGSLAYSSEAMVKEYVRPDEVDGWRLLQGVVTIDKRFTQVSRVLFYIVRDIIDVKMYVDDVSMSLIPEQCDDLVMNGDFATGDSQFWRRHDDYAAGGTLEMFSPGVDGSGDMALVMPNRVSRSWSMRQDIRVGCMEAGERYVVQSRFQLQKSDGTFFACDASITSGYDECPEMELKTYVDEDLPTEQTHEDSYAARTAFPTTSNGWNTLIGIYTATDVDAAADKARLTWDQVDSDFDLIVDDVSITPLPMDCSNLIMNGDAEHPTGSAAFWLRYGNAGSQIDVVDVSPAQDNSEHAFKNFARSSFYYGMEQEVDARCLNEGDSWNIKGQFKLLDSETGAPVTCNPTSTSSSYGCPPIRIRGFVDGVEVYDEIFYNSLSVWSADAMNEYERKITVDGLLASADMATVAIRNYNMAWDIVVDNLSIAPL